MVGKRKMSNGNVGERFVNLLANKIELNVNEIQIELERILYF